MTMTCDTMSYNGNTKLLTATGSVRAVDAQGMVLTGDNAVADLDLQQIHIPPSGHVGIGRRPLKRSGLDGTSVCQRRSTSAG